MWFVALLIYKILLIVGGRLLKNNLVEREKDCNLL